MVNPAEWIPEFESPDHICTNNRSQPNQHFHFRGAALGGWLVIEPWITPSLFYQFFGAYEKWGEDAPRHVAIDCYTFCTALGKEEANKQLRRHWRTWVTEKDIKNLKLSGADTLRIPVADWMYKPYEPFVGCWDGALDELDRVLLLCKKYGLNAILDIHTMRYSQNGMDNSGRAGNIEWSIENRDTAQFSSGKGDAAIPTDATQPKVIRYRHWQIQSANWIGNYNAETKTYDSINMTNINHGLDVVRDVVSRYRNNSVVVGLEPVNEPWWETPIPWLKHFYWETYQIVQRDAPHWVTLLHDSFRFYLKHWGSFMVNCPNYAIDVHLYQAWYPPLDGFSYQSYACEDGLRVREMEAAGVPVVVGEWSLATDSCALWLGGFNDNGPGNPKVECGSIQCPAPYMGPGQPNAPPDPTKGPQDPFGSGAASYVDHGMCPVDKAFENEDQVIQALAYSKLHSYDRSSHGQFFWNFRTELETRWDFQQAVKRKWIPTDWTDVNTMSAIELSCPIGTFRPMPLPEPGTGPRASATQEFINGHMFGIGLAIVVVNIALLLYAFLRTDLFSSRWRYMSIGSKSKSHSQQLSHSGDRPRHHGDRHGTEMTSHVHTYRLTGTIVAVDSASSLSAPLGHTHTDGHSHIPDTHGYQHSSIHSQQTYRAHHDTHDPSHPHGHRPPGRWSSPLFGGESDSHHGPESSSQTDGSDRDDQPHHSNSSQQLTFMEWIEGGHESPKKAGSKPPWR